MSKRQDLSATVAVTNPEQSLITGVNTGSQISRKEHSHPAAYSFRHTLTGKLYVGSTSDLYNRVNQHRNDLVARRHGNRKFQEAFNQDPRFDLSFVVTTTKEDALEIEQKVLDSLWSSQTMLNISPSAYSASGTFKTDQQKELSRLRAVEQFSSEDSRIHHSQLSRKQWEDPVYRANQSRSSKERWEKPGFREAQIEDKKSKWSDEGYRAKMLESLRKTHQLNQKPVCLDGIEYPSIKAACKRIGVSDKTLKKRLGSQVE